LQGKKGVLYEEELRVESRVLRVESTEDFWVIDDRQRSTLLKRL
jgi:hypothetical protein